MIQRFFKLLLISILALTGKAFAQVELNYNEPEIFILAGVNVNASEMVDKDAVINISGLRVGEKITIPGSQISDAIKRLWKEEIFSYVEVNVENLVDNKIFLEIVLKERPKIADLIIEGVGNSQADDLSSKMKWKGTILTDAKKETANRIVQNYFREKGYLNANAEVVSSKHPTLHNFDNVTVKVTKGEKVKIHKIYFNGLANVEAKDCKKKMKKTKEKKIYRIFSRSKFVQPLFSADKEHVVEFLNSKGYRDAQLIADSVTAYDEKSIDLHISVYEGTQYFIRNLTITGNNKYSTDQLMKIINMKRGDVYDMSYLDRKLYYDPNGMDISSLYLDDGYLFFNVRAVEIAVDGDSIDVELRMYEGPQAIVDKIYVEGNTKTSDHVILREIKLLPGDRFSRTDLIRSQREILNLGYFDQENMKVIPMPDRNRGTVDLKFIVQEKPSDQLQFQAGWGGRIRDNNGNVIGGGLVGTIAVTFNNFSTKRFFDGKAWRPLPSGDGQKLSLAIQANGNGFQNYSISFVEPWFGGKKANSLGVSANYSIQKSVTTNYKIGIFGASVDLGKRMKFPDDFFRSYTTLGYRYYDIKNAFTTFGIDNGYVNIISVRQSFERSSTDAPIYPRSGSILTLSIEATPPYSLLGNKNYKQLNENGDYESLYKFLEFHKWKIQSSWFLKIVGNLVLNPKFQFGYLGQYNPDYGLVPFERFYLGGDGLSGYNLDGREILALRGYQNNSIGPRNSLGFPTGATMFNKYTCELRYALSLKAIPVWVHAFAEAGNGWSGFKAYNPFVLKRSVGLGVRVFMPMLGGIIGVDWGYPLDDEFYPGDSSPRFHFMLGQQF